MSNSPGPDFDGAYSRAWERNCAEFKLAEAAKHIKTFSEKTSIDEGTIRQKITTDPIFRLVFVKDPKRQKIHEKEAADWLRQQPGIGNLQRLGPSDRAACAGRVIPRANLRKRVGSTAATSLDFKWTTRDHTVYAAHKYTFEGGGAQNNQYKELHAFIDEANASTAPRTIFIAIADGPYYATRSGPRNATRMDELRQAANGRTVFAGRSVDVPVILRDNVP